MSDTGGTGGHISHSTSGHRGSGGFGKKNLINLKKYLKLILELTLNVKILLKKV